MEPWNEARGLTPSTDGQSTSEILTIVVRRATVTASNRIGETVSLSNLFLSSLSAEFSGP